MIRWALLALAFLPALSTAGPAEPAPEWRYTIRPGDTLIRIGNSYLKNPEHWLHLQRLNAIANPRQLQPGSSLRIPLALLKQEPAPAKVVSVSGRVVVEMAGTPAAALVAGRKLSAGAAIKTEADGSAEIMFADGSTLILQPGSTLELDTLSVYAGGGMVDTRVRLQQGRAELSVNPRKQPSRRLEVITPSAVAAVRGTQFRVSANETLMREETLEGQVAVAASGEEVTVAKAQGTVAEAGKPPIPPVALLPAPDVSALSRKLDRYPLRFPLPELAGASCWLGQIAPDDHFNAILKEKLTPGPVMAFADELPDGKYYLRLRGLDALGLQGLDGVHAFEVDARPFPPLLGTPVNEGKVRLAQPSLDWTHSLDAQRYRVQLSRTPDFQQYLLDQEIDAVSQQTPALTEGEHYWRVASIDSAGEQGPYSDVRRFVYKALPGAPDLSHSAFEFRHDSINIDLPGLPPDLHYEVILARDAELADVLWQGQPNGVKLSMPRPAGGKYYLAVRAAEADGTAGPFNKQTVEVPRRPWWPALMLLSPLLFL